MLCRPTTHNTMFANHATNLRVPGLITDEQIIQCKQNLEFVALVACSDHDLDTYSDIIKQLTPYSFVLWAGEEDHQMVATGCFHVDHIGRVVIVVSRMNPKGLAEVSDIPALLEYCNIVHEDGGKLMWVEGLNRTVHDMLEDIKVCMCGNARGFPFSHKAQCCATSTIILAS